MNLNDYQQKALTTAIDSGDAFKNLTHWILGTVEEAGELAAKFKRVIRDNNSNLDSIDKEAFTGEIGDVLWHLAVLAHELGIPFEDVGKYNLDKLAERKRRGTIQGAGDNR